MKKSQKAISIVIIVIFLAAFAVWGYCAKNGLLTNFDLPIQSFFFSLRNKITDPFCIALEYVGHWPLPALVGIIFLFIKKTRVSYGVPLALSVATSVGLYVLFKNIFQRARPDSSLWLCNEHGFSFPSGHTLNNMVFWIVLASLIGYYYKTKGENLPLLGGSGKHYKDNKKAIYPKTKGKLILLEFILFLWPITISLSRIYVGVHWPSDVVGSWILTVALLNIWKLVFFSKKIKTQNNTEIEEDDDDDDDYDDDDEEE